MITPTRRAAVIWLAICATAEDAKLNVNIRSKGGASLHSWGFEISVNVPIRIGRSLR
jgi:hypothetical protein